MATSRFRARALVLAMSAAALTALTTVASTGTALACGPSGRSDAFARTLPQVRPGRSDATVLGLQLNLKQRGYPLVGTGYYGSDTLKAVKDFQRKHHIKASGIVGSKTWHALVGTLSRSGTHKPEEPRQTLRPGSHDYQLLAQLQNVLERIPPYNPSVYQNTYGPAMQKLARDFQHRTHIKASGIVGAKTWHALFLVVAIEGNWGC
jgi:peptidoglycan hydrolase-like protein with peptidoglycan-binding domain